MESNETHKNKQGQKGEGEVTIQQRDSAVEVVSKKELTLKVQVMYCMQ